MYQLVAYFCFNISHNVQLYAPVRDFKAQSCQIAEKLNRITNVQIRRIPRMAYIACCALAVFMFNPICFQICCFICPCARAGILFGKFWIVCLPAGLANVYDCEAWAIHSMFFLMFL